MKSQSNSISKSKRQSAKPITTAHKQLSRSPTNKNSSKTNQTKTGNQKQQEKVILNTISKENFDISDMKFNITEIAPLEVKYVLKCIGGIYKNRFLYITTHKDGEVLGSGEAKENGLTLQIQGAGLSVKHVKLKFNGFKKFYVKDYGSESGTWMTIPKDGTEIKHGTVYLIGNLRLRFELGHCVNQIEEVCDLYSCNYLSDILMYNKITDLPSLYRAQYEKFKGYPFDEKTLFLLQRICDDSKNWFNEENQYRKVHIFYENEEIYGVSEEVGWKEKKIYSKLEDAIKGDFLYVDSKEEAESNPINDKNGTLFEDNQQIEESGQYEAKVIRGRLVPKNRIFAKILPQKNYQLQLHDQIRIGDLSFELNRFNVGIGEDIGHRKTMEDCYIIEEDIGGSQWKLISLFAVVDGYGGSQCVNYVKENLVKKVRSWTSMLDEAGDLNQMIKVLMNKTFFEIDYEFFQKYEEIAMTCGATLVVMLIIDSKVYVFNLGDSKGYIYREEKIYQMTIDHIPSRIDEKMRIQQVGGVIQYGRLMGKCTLSRALGQFEYKNLQDYERNMKGKLKSYLTCIPEIKCFDLKPFVDDFIFLTTDGILDAIDIKSVTSFIIQKSTKLESEENPDKIISSLMENSKITNPNCDNMAAILIFVKKGKIGSKISF